jgi:peptide/nickel transport system ATP-binding protein
MRGKTLETIPGSPPSLAHLPPGCAFAPRCRFAEERCVAAQPPLVEIGPGTIVRCIRAQAPADIAA